MSITKLHQLRKERLASDLNEMLTDSTYYSICVVRDLAKALGLKTHGNATYEELSLYHCNDYEVMGLEERVLLTELTLEFLGFKSAQGESEVVNPITALINKLK